MTEKLVTDRRGLWKPLASWIQRASLARATFPPRWTRERMPLESPFCPQTFFVCNCTRADGSFPWKVWWSKCRWLGSERCWWAEWRSPPKRWYCLEGKKWKNLSVHRWHRRLLCLPSSAPFSLKTKSLVFSGCLSGVSVLKEWTPVLWKAWGSFCMFFPDYIEVP